MLGPCARHVAAMRALALTSYIPVATRPIFPVRPIRSTKPSGDVPPFLFPYPVVAMSRSPCWVFALTLHDARQNGVLKATLCGH
jgi:hypothetical protein